MDINNLNLFCATLRPANRESILRTVYYQQNLKFLKKHPTFCLYPFFHLEIKNDIGSPLCCSANGIDNSFQETLDQTSLQEDLVNKKFDNVRQLMLKNKLPNNCERICPSNKTNTMRDQINIKHDVSILFENIVATPTLKKVNWKFGSTCNLACRMCSPTISSHMNKTLNAFKNENENEFSKYEISPVADSFTTPETMSKLKALLPQLETLMISGGEPFLSNDVEIILKEAIKNKDNEHITLIITTNGTKFIKPKLDIFLKFKKLELIISIDGMEDTYDYIRYPFTFNMLHERIQNLKLYIDKHNLQDKVSIRYNCLGLLYNLFDYHKLEHRFKPFIVDFSAFGSENGNHVLNLKYAPRTLINEAIKTYKGFNERPWYKELVKISNNVNSFSDICRYQEKSIKYTLLFDRMYKQDYNKYLHPSIVNFLNYKY